MHVHVVAGQLFCGQLSSHHLSLSASKSEPGPVVVPLQIPNVQPGSATHVDSCSYVQSEVLSLHVLQTWGVHPSGTAGGSDGRGDGGGGGGGDGQTAADQLYAFVKAATSFHASCITCLLHSSEASAEPSNILSILDALETSQAEMPGWLKAVSPFLPLNVVIKCVTLLVSHTSGWLKSKASLNVFVIVVTSLVSQASSELKS